MRFLGEGYLLGSENSKTIFNKIKDIPIIDPHNHADIKGIAYNKNYVDPWQFLVGTDHYIWALMRKLSIAEKFITGSATPKEKWLKLAEVFPYMAGNPVYEWTHLELKRFLGVDILLNSSTGEEIWNRVSSLLQLPEYRPQSLLEKLNIEVMCSSDDPIDWLDYHRKINKDMGRIVVLPSWRADKIVKTADSDWLDYVKKLTERFGASSCSSIEELVGLLRKSHDYFAENGCKISDHGLEVPFPCISEKKEADKIFKMLLNNERPSAEELYILADYLFSQLAEMDSEKKWVFQIHIGAVRNTRNSIFSDVGADSGCDVSDHFIDMLPPLIKFLNRFDNRLKVTLYCLDFVHQQTLTTLAHSFGSNTRLGAAWWFCDTPLGMKRQLEMVSSIDLLYSFAGMVSDSRRILSYGSRFEMFRRVLSDFLGKMVIEDRIPKEIAYGLSERISYSGPKEFFNL